MGIHDPTYSRVAKKLLQAIERNDHEQINFLVETSGTYILSDILLPKRVKKLTPIPVPSLPLSSAVETFSPYDKVNALTYAVLKAETETVQLLLELGAKPNAFLGEALLYTAHPQTRGGLEKLTLILNNGGSLSSIKNLMNFGVHLARLETELELWQTINRFAERSGQRIPEALIDGLLVGAVYWGKLPLLKTIGKEREKTLWEERFDDLGNSLLHYATFSPNLAKNLEIFKETVNYLLDIGIDINDVNKKGDTPLHFLCAHAGEEEVKFFIEQGADVNAKDMVGFTPINILLSEVRNPYQGNKFYPLERTIKVLKVLLENGADPNSIDVFGNTVLSSYIESSERLSAKVLKTLLEYNGDPNLVTPRMGAPLLAKALQRASERWEDLGEVWKIIRVLLKSGADPSLEDKNGYSFLSRLAAFLVEEEINIGREWPTLEKLISLAVERGARVGKLDSSGYSPLHIAAWKGNMVLGLYLPFASSSDINTPTASSQANVLHVAATSGNIKEVLLLLEREKNLTLKGPQGENLFGVLLETGLSKSHLGKHLGSTSFEEREAFFIDLWYVIALLEKREKDFFQHKSSEATVLHFLSNTGLC